MRDYAVFKDGHREEIIFYRMINYNPPHISFMTPSGIYLYEECSRERDTVFGEQRPILTLDNRFYKYDKENIDLVEYFPFASKDIKARWVYCNDIESINFRFPE